MHKLERKIASMKFYIASSFKNKEHVRYLAEGLVHNGHLQTYDWTQNTQATTEKELQFIGSKEKQAVVDCDVFYYASTCRKRESYRIRHCDGFGKNNLYLFRNNHTPRKSKYLLLFAFYPEKAGTTERFSERANKKELIVC